MHAMIRNERGHIMSIAEIEVLKRRVEILTRVVLVLVGNDDRIAESEIADELRDAEYSDT
jgi:hypothetical protein